jgi:hypothetical protein
MHRRPDLFARIRGADAALHRPQDLPHPAGPWCGALLAKKMYRRHVVLTEIMAAPGQCRHR